MKNLDEIKKAFIGKTIQTQCEGKVYANYVIEDVVLSFFVTESYVLIGKPSFPGYVGLEYWHVEKLLKEGTVTDNVLGNIVTAVLS